MDRSSDAERRALTALTALEEVIGHNEQMRSRTVFLLERGERNHLRRHLARPDERAAILHRQNGRAVWRLYVIRAGNRQ